MDSDVRRIMGLGIGWFTGICIVIIGLIVLGIGIWRLDWFIANANTTQEAHLLHNQQKVENARTRLQQESLGSQAADETDMTNQIASVDTLTAQMAAYPAGSALTCSTSASEWCALRGQRIAIARIACADAGKLTTIPPDQAGWVRQNCQAGTVSPASLLER